jgi:hypothetical protein
MWKGRITFIQYHTSPRTFLYGRNQRKLGGHRLRHSASKPQWAHGSQPGDTPQCSMTQTHKNTNGPSDLRATHQHVF